MNKVIHFPGPDDFQDPVSLGDLPEAAIYTVAQAATLLGISAGLAYQLVRAGEIPAKRLGRRWISRATGSTPG